MTLRYELKERAESSLYSFFIQSWPIIEGHSKFVDEWFLEVIAEHLELVYYRKIKNLLINVPPRVGKPVGQFTLLQRDDGLRIAIKDIKEGDYILTDKGRYKKVLRKYYQGLMDVYTIRTSGYREVIAEGSHPFLTTEGWKEAKDLRITDTLATVETREDNGISIPLEEARLIGYILGDGCVVRNQCNITCADEVQLQDMINCANKLGFNYHIFKYKRKETYKLLTRFSLSKGVNSVRDWCKKHNLSNKNSYTKRIPDIIFRANKEVIGNFIGAYIACDGSVYKSSDRTDIRLEIGSVSEDLLMDVNHLLNRLGIRCYIRKCVSNRVTKRQGNTYTHYKLRTCGQDDMYRLSKVVPIYGEKQSKLLNGVIPKVNFDPVYMIDPISSIEKSGVEECYCLEVEDDHTFTANDIIVHNTSLISIAFPAWVWIKDPTEKFICASCTNSLSLDIADKSRLLIESPWYQENWGHLFKIRADQNAKSYFANDQTGYRISSSVGSMIIGKGGSIQLTDDPNVVGGESEVVRDGVLNWWSMKWYNRLNDIPNDRRILVQQRGDEKDVSGNVIVNDINNEWVKLILPLEYESENKCSTVPLWWTKGKAWEDPRTRDGELLTKRLNIDDVNKIKKELGSYGYAALYQQRPAPLEGGIIKKHWFKIYRYDQLPQIDYTIQSWDTALTANDNSAYSACTTWGLFQDRYDNTNVILLSAWRGRLEYPELRERVRRLSLNYMDVGENPPAYSNRYVPDQIVIEAKASGDPLLQDLRRAGVYGQPFIPNKHGDKTQRVRLITPLIEAGVVWVPSQVNNPDRMADFADEFVNEVSYFPNPRSLDYTDTLTQALIVLRDGSSIKNPKDYYEPDDRTEEVKRFY